MLSGHTSSLSSFSDTAKSHKKQKMFSMIIFIKADEGYLVTTCFSPVAQALGKRDMPRGGLSQGRLGGRAAVLRTSLTCQVHEPSPSAAAGGLASHCTPLPSFRLSVSVSLSLPISVSLWDTRCFSGTGHVWVADASTVGRTIKA